MTNPVLAIVAIFALWMGFAFACSLLIRYGPQPLKAGATVLLLLTYFIPALQAVVALEDWVGESQSVHIRRLGAAAAFVYLAPVAPAILEADDITIREFGNELRHQFGTGDSA